MFGQHTPRMHPHILMPEHLLRWLGLGALAIIVAVIALLFVRTPPVIAPETTAPQPAVSHPYDGSAYVRYLTERPALPWSLEYGPRFNPGTGTVYDGKSYEQRALAVNPNVPNIGTGSAYDGNDYSGVTALPWSLEYGPRFNPGTGTVYDGKPYAQPVPAVKPNVPIDGTGSAYDGQ